MRLIVLLLAVVIVLVAFRYHRVGATRQLNASVSSVSIATQEPPDPVPDQAGSDAPLPKRAKSDRQFYKERVQEYKAQDYMVNRVGITLALTAVAVLIVGTLLDKRRAARRRRRRPISKQAPCYGGPRRRAS